MDIKLRGFGFSILKRMLNLFAQSTPNLNVTVFTN